MFYWWVGWWVELFAEKEKAPVRGLSLCSTKQKAESLPELLAETRGFEPPIRVLAPMLP